MQQFISLKSNEYKDLIKKIDEARANVGVVRENHRQTIADEIYFTSDEILKYLHISQRTLQNLRDNNKIAFTMIGGKILYPERELQNILIKNLHTIP